MRRRIFAGNRKRKWSFINTLLKAVAFLKVYFNAFRRKFDVIWSSFFFFIDLSQEMTTAQRPLERPHTDTKSWHKENLRICRLRSQGSERGICVLALWNFLSLSTVSIAKHWEDLTGCRFPVFEYFPLPLDVICYCLFCFLVFVGKAKIKN